MLEDNAPWILETPCSRLGEAYSSHYIIDYALFQPSDIEFPSSTFALYRLSTEPKGDKTFMVVLAWAPAVEESWRLLLPNIGIAFE